MTRPEAMSETLHQTFRGLLAEAITTLELVPYYQFTELLLEEDPSLAGSYLEEMLGELNTYLDPAHSEQLKRRLGKNQYLAEVDNALDRKGPLAQLIENWQRFLSTDGAARVLANHREEQMSLSTGWLTD